MHVVIFLANRYKSTYRTSTGESVVNSLRQLTPFWTNLPFHEFPEILNHERLLKCLGKSWKGRFVQNGGELPTAGGESNRSMCDICLCISFVSLLYLFCTSFVSLLYFLARKSQHVSSPLSAQMDTRKIAPFLVATRRVISGKSLKKTFQSFSIHTQIENYWNFLLTIFPRWVHKWILALVVTKSRLFLVASRLATRILTHRPIRFASRCAISVSLGHKITTCQPYETHPFLDNLHGRFSQKCQVVIVNLKSNKFNCLTKTLHTAATCIIAQRPIRFASRCAISVFVSLGETNHNMGRVDLRYLLVSFGKKITTCIIAHRPGVFHHSSDPNCAISGPLLNEEHHHTWVLEFGQDITNSFS